MAELYRSSQHRLGRRQPTQVRGRRATTWLAWSIAVLFFVLVSPVGAEPCLDCHANPRAEGQPIQIDRAALSRGPHASLACVECHSEVTTIPHKSTPPPVSVDQCNTCHQQARADYTSSVHWAAVKQGNQEAPVCSSCHGAHDILPATDPESAVSPQNVIWTCAKCHDDPVVLATADIADDVVETYFASYHGLVKQNGMTEAANCSSCHGSMAILPSSDPHALTHPKNLVQLCGKCHPDAERFATYKVHRAAVIPGNLPEDGHRPGPGWWSGLRLFFPIANRSLNPLAIVGLGALIGTISALFGVGGGFLLTPMLMFIGVPPAVAAATDAGTIVAHGSSGTLGHYRHGNVDLKVGVLCLFGSALGGTTGVFVVRWLRQLGNFDFAIRIVYIIVLTAIGLGMVLEGVASMRSPRAPATSTPSTDPEKSLFMRVLQNLPFQVEFQRSRIRCSALLPFCAGGVVGLLAAFLGSGGGFIMLPVMIYLLGMPTRVAVGTNLFQVTLTCLNVAIQQAVVNQTVDVMLVVTLFVGSVVGAQLGVRVSGLLRGEQTRALLGLIVLGVMGALLFSLLVTPDNPVAVVMQGGSH